MVSPLFVELGSVAVLLLFLRLSKLQQPWDALGLALGAVAGEELCIRGYGAYQYAPSWSLFLDRVPLAVALIWPAVVLSARAVVRSVRPGAGALAVGLLVAFDAALVEPIATHAGLWSWNLPGFLDVPLIGPLGWGCYGAAATLVQDRVRRRGLRLLALVVLSPLLAHAGILALWWGALRWLQQPIPAALAAACAMALCAVLAGLIVRARLRLSWRDALSRAAAASVFAALLWARPEPHLVAYAASFALPWLALLDYGGSTATSP